MFSMIRNPVGPWHLVERGNSQKGVNKRIIQFLCRHFKNNELGSLFDAPCGQGEFLKAIQTFFPKCYLEGQDLFAKPLPEISKYFRQGDLKNAFEQGSRQFDVISCISGVMVVDCISTFIEAAEKHLNPGGILIVTNDNILTLRDRLSFFFLGRFRRFKLGFGVDEGNWNLVMIQSLWKLMRTNQLEIIKVEYCSFYLEDVFSAPLAAVIYPFWWLYIRFSHGLMAQETRQKLFPFAALLARHYIIYARKS